jgi:hypothetical protein
VREHSRNCVICRRELEELETVAARIAASSRVPLPPPDMRRINARIDAELQRAGRGSALLARLRDWGANPWRVAFALQTVVLVALAVAWLRPDEPDALYTTLTAPAESAGDGEYLRVVFEPGLEAGAIDALLAERGLVVTAGPSPRGVYTLEFTAIRDAGGRAAVLAELQADPQVLFVQPVTEPGAP